MNAFFCRWRLHRNERGFVLPLTMIILFLLFSFLLHEIKIYETEKQFVHHQEDMLTLDRLLQMAAVDIEKNRLSDWPDSFMYDNGTVDYSEGTIPKGVDLDPENVIYLKLEAKVIGGSEQEGFGSRHISYVYYDKDKKKIVRWVEPVTKK